MCGVVCGVWCVVCGVWCVQQCIGTAIGVVPVCIIVVQYIYTPFCSK